MILMHLSLQRHFPTTLPTISERMNPNAKIPAAARNSGYEKGREAARDQTGKRQQAVFFKNTITSHAKNMVAEMDNIARKSQADCQTPCLMLRRQSMRVYPFIRIKKKGRHFSLKWYPSRHPLAIYILYQLQEDLCTWVLIARFIAKAGNSRTLHAWLSPGWLSSWNMHLLTLGEPIFSPDPKNCVIVCFGSSCYSAVSLQKEF